MDAVFSGASIDSRAIREGELFIPLKGGKADGHDFIESAILKGMGSLVGREAGRRNIKGGVGKVLIEVEDALRALQAIARFVRMKRPELPVVGITGSNGKTTTKELAALVLESRFKVLKTTGNLNNQIGLPLTLCSLDGSHGAAVLEMGASFPGDIKELCEIAAPTHGVITNIGQSHLEGFGSMEALLRTKLELADAAQTVAYNADDPVLAPAMKPYGGKALVGFGMGAGAVVRALDLVLEERGSAFTLRAGGQSAGASLPVPGVFNVYNALAAAAAGVAFGIGLDAIADSLRQFRGVPMRYEIMERNGALIINDVYNANPASVREALKELRRLRRNGGRAIAVLGDMLELGEFSEEAHRGLGSSMAGEPGMDLFIAVGPMMATASWEFAKRGGASVACDTPEGAGCVLFKELRPGDTVLIKGSRGMRMERVLEKGKE
jgi:UDP-N-acetylmuramoyl-tripeptide--D-alanyl-D-alanine ligase